MLDYPGFDAAFYLQANPDLQVAFGNNKLYATIHFIRHGSHEGRQYIKDREVIDVLDDNNELSNWTIDSVHGDKYLAILHNNQVSGAFYVAETRV